MFDIAYSILARLLQTLCFYTDDLAFADPAQEVAEYHDIMPGNMKIELCKMLGSLFFLLAVFGIGVWLFKKYLKSRGSILSNSSTIKILDRRSLTQKTCIYIIRVVNKTLVIAETGDRVTLLTEFPPNTDLNELIESTNKKKNIYPTSKLMEEILRPNKEFCTQEVE